MPSPALPRRPFTDGGKRVFHLVLAIPLAVLSLPFFVTVAMLVRLFLGSPVPFG